MEERLFRPQLTFTDLPVPRWWGLFVRFLKSFEVWFLKLLEIFGVYSPRKLVIGIPAIATHTFTHIQALVFNGTLEEILGFRPRALIHRVLRGVPDVESYERLEFQVAFGDREVRRVEGSTQTRGFVSLQVPWGKPKGKIEKAWLRMHPKGVETIFGAVQLGRYEILSSPLFFLHSDIRSIVVSDIDDTIKDTRIGETTSLSQIITSIFRGHYYRYEPIKGMAELYQDLRSKGHLILYLTSTPFQLAPFLLKFLKDCNFPEGPVFMRWLGYGRFGHKYRTLSRLLPSLEGRKCVLIGDSGEQDLQIYRRVMQNEQLGPLVDKILIRHVPGTPIAKTIDSRELFYNEMDALREAMKHLL